MSTWSVVLAAGQGQRSGVQKQFEPLGDRRLVDWTVGVSACVTDHVCLVVPPGHEWGGPEVDIIVTGGDSHFASARAGVTALPESALTIVLAAPSHPLATIALYARVLEAIVVGIDAVGAAQPLTDALKRIENDSVTTVDRERLRTVQMPMAFRASVLRPLLLGETEAAEELELVELAGGRIAFVDGEPTNIHVTTGVELAMARALLPHLRPELPR